jgi:hypothetical protein
MAIPPIAVEAPNTCPAVFDEPLIFL